MLIFTPQIFARRMTVTKIGKFFLVNFDLLKFTFLRLFLKDQLQN
jgi:hypothetical protein